MHRCKKVHVTFPVLNEETQLESSILQTLEFCVTNRMEDFELCIADNGSTDSTELIGRNLEARFDQVKYLRIPKRGVGIALKTSWSQSRSDYVGYMDLDLSTDLKHFREVYDLIQHEADYALIVGSRLRKGAKVEKRSVIREITSRCFNLWLRLNLDVNFTDGMCGFKFIKRSFYERLAAQFEITDEWFFATELAVRTEWLGGEIMDLPVHWIDDANSKSSTQLLRLARQYVIGIERLRQEKKRFVAPQEAS
jgi:glycosyltransferase involved in cell wall biosynthesis